MEEDFFTVPQLPALTPKYSVVSHTFQHDTPQTQEAIFWVSLLCESRDPRLIMPPKCFLQEQFGATVPPKNAAPNHARLWRPFWPLSSSNKKTGCPILFLGWLTGMVSVALPKSSRSLEKGFYHFISNTFCCIYT